MPLTGKGEKIMRAMKAEYGSAKGEQVFYASKNEGRLSGVDCDFDQGDFNRAKAARDFKTRDLSPDEFDKLKALLSEWVDEEKKEPEHQQDEWSPEAREAAAKARGGQSGTTKARNASTKKVAGGYEGRMNGRLVSVPDRDD